MWLNNIYVLDILCLWLSFLGAPYLQILTSHDLQCFSSCLHLQPPSQSRKGTRNARSPKKPQHQRSSRPPMLPKVHNLRFPVLLPPMVLLPLQARRTVAEIEGALLSARLSAPPRLLPQPPSVPGMSALTRPRTRRLLTRWTRR